MTVIGHPGVTWMPGLIIKPDLYEGTLESTQTIRMNGVSDKKVNLEKMYGLSAG